MSGQLVEQWPVKLLGEVCKLRNGRAYKKTELLDEGKYRVLRVGNFFTNKHWYYSDLELDETKFCETGDLLYAWSASFGPRIWEGEKSIFHYHIWRVDYDEQILNKKYLYYWLLWDAEKIKSEQGTGTTMIHVSMKSMNAREISIPPLNEQQRIVNILDATFKEINGSIESTESSLIHSAEIFPSKLHDIYSEGGSDWSDYTLAEVSLDFGRGKSKHRPRNYKPLYGGPYPFVQTGDVRSSNHYISEYTQTYSEMGLAQSKLWPKGTVCITIAANIAETAILDFEACFPDSVIGVVVNPEITTNEYVEYALQFFKTKLQKEGKGSAQDNINMGTFKELKFPFAPLSEQKKIVDLLNMLNEQTSSSIEFHQSKLQHLEELKQSILQEAFNGTL